jgi:hypothetical protein
MISSYATHHLQTPAMSPAMRALEEVVVNQAMTRMQLIQRLMDPRRDIDKECGYPVDPIPAHDYQKLYDRDAIASRVNEIFPQECWQVDPQVYEDEDADTLTPFEQDWQSLAYYLKGERSWWNDEEGHPIWDYLYRADEQSGIGSYGVVLLGLDDLKPGDSLDKPAVPGNEQAPRRLLYMRVFPESLSPIVAYENNVSSPRYQKPLMYQLTFYDPLTQQSTSTTAAGPTSQVVNVHWSRVIHIADNVASNEVQGNPRARPVLNHILDLRKIYGASAEGFWQNAFSALTFVTHPQLGGNVRVNVQELKDAVENYINGLQRHLIGKGGEWKNLAPSVVDPSGQIEKHIEAICIKGGYPVRIFKGSERGELASSQDERGWGRRVQKRQKRYLTPRVICPVADRLISLGVVRPPKTGYCVWWPDIMAQTDAEKAAVGLQRTQALAAYISGQGETVVQPVDFLSKFLGVDEGEAQSILDATMSMYGGKLPIPQAAPPGTPPPASTGLLQPSLNASFFPNAPETNGGTAQERKVVGKKKARTARKGMPTPPPSRKQPTRRSPNGTTA